MVPALPIGLPTAEAARAIRRLLTTLSGHGPNLLAFGAFLGLAWPGLAELAAPAMSAAIFLLILGSLLRIAPGQFRRVLARPMAGLVLPLLAMLPCPLAAGLLARLAGLPPEMVLALVLSTAAPPSIGNAAMARMLRLDDAAVLVATLLAMALAPLTVPLAAMLFGGLALDPLALALRLLALVGGAACLALPLRRHAAAAIERQAPLLDALLLAALLVFALSAMAGLQARLAAEPLVALAQVALAFGVNLGLQGLGALFLPGSLAQRAAGALLLGNRNVGLVWSALGSAAPPAMALYFAATQLPIYTLPRLLQALLARGAASSPRLGRR